MAALAQTALRHVPDVAESRFRARRPRRPVGAAEAALAEIFLRRDLARSCSKRSRGCRNTIRPAASSRSSRTTPPIWRRSMPARRRADRIRHRLDAQGAHAARRGAGDRRLCAGRHLLRDAAAGSGRAAARLSAPDGASGRGRFHQAVPAAARRSRRGRASASSRDRPSAISSRTTPRRFLQPCRHDARQRCDADHRLRSRQGRERSSTPPTTTPPASPRASISIC